MAKKKLISLEDSSLSLRQIIDSSPALLHTARPDGDLDFLIGLGLTSPANRWRKCWDGMDTLLRRHNVDLYVSGHDHDLQHLEFKGHPTSFVISCGGRAERVDWTTQPLE